jgi:hypothetical protein
MPPRSKLTGEQIELVARFGAGALEYLGLTFDQVAQKILGARPFANTPTGREFRRQAKLAFDRARPRLDLAHLEWKRRRVAARIYSRR